MQRLHNEFLIGEVVAAPIPSSGSMQQLNATPFSIQKRVWIFMLSSLLLMFWFFTAALKIWHCQMARFGSCPNLN
jgi:hypothetical protein